MTPTPERDRDLLIRMLETQAEMKAMLKTAIEKQSKTDEKVEAIGGRVTILELEAAKAKGKSQLIGGVFGLAGGGAVTIIAAFFRDKLGF